MCQSSKRKAGNLDVELSSCLAYRSLPRHILGLMNDVQPLLAFMLIFIATLIRFCDQVDFGVSHLKSVV